MLYVLICLIVALALVLISSYIPKKSRTHCRCGKRADIVDPDRPWRVWCAGCHVRYLLRKGEIL